jgi:hypothetical protein
LPSTTMLSAIFFILALSTSLLPLPSSLGKKLKKSRKNKKTPGNQGNQPQKSLLGDLGKNPDDKL